MQRCAWVTVDTAYIAYHDNEWGVPVHEDRKLFEMLILEGTQAGLSWLTVLRKRENYRKLYDGFDPYKLAQWDQEKIESLLKDSRIIRNRSKIGAARTNARAFLQIKEEFGSFDTFIWGFVKGTPIHNSWKSIQEIPPTTPESDSMSRELRKRGLKYVGSTICYAFMQAVGMVNDHTVDCFRFTELS